MKKEKIYSNYVLKEAYALGGFRERYAMEHGESETVVEGGRTLFVFRYDDRDSYQDGNGAAYDPQRKAWVN